MTFVVNAIKQENDVTVSYGFLLDVPEESIGREIMQRAGMILLSIAKYTGNNEDFGSLHLKIVHNGAVYEIISSLSLSLRDLCSFFVRSGFDVVDINSYIEPEEPEHVKRIIELCKTAYQKELDDARINKLKKEEEAKKNKLFADKMLDNAKLSTNWLLDKLQVLLTTKRIHIPPKDQRWIDQQLNEIKKQRMGSNYEKIRVLLQDLFIFLNSLEDAHYTSLNTDGDVLFEGTSVTTYDLERQVEILEEVKYQAAFGGDVVGWRKEYSTLPFFPYFLFLKKDFFALFDNIDTFLKGFLDFLFFTIISFIVVLSLVVFANQTFELSLNLTFLYYVLFGGGWFSLLLFLSLFGKKDKSYKYLLGLIFVVILIFFITFPILENSFALR